MSCKLCGDQPVCDCRPIDISWLQLAKGLVRDWWPFAAVTGMPALLAAVLFDAAFYLFIVIRR